MKDKETVTDVGKIILSNNANTMSDRASTEEKSMKFESAPCHA